MNLHTRHTWSGMNRSHMDTELSIFTDSSGVFVSDRSKLGLQPWFVAPQIIRYPEFNSTIAIVDFCRIWTSKELWSNFLFYLLQLVTWQLSTTKPSSCPSSASRCSTTATRRWLAVSCKSSCNGSNRLLSVFFWCHSWRRHVDILHRRFTWSRSSKPASTFTSLSVSYSAWNFSTCIITFNFASLQNNQFPSFWF